MLYKEIREWKERHDKVQEQLAFIKEIQKAHSHENHGIKVLTKEEFIGFE